METACTAGVLLSSAAPSASDRYPDTGTDAGHNYPATIEPPSQEVDVLSPLSVSAMHRPTLAAT